MIILGTNSIKDTGFDVANSLRFNDGSSDYLTRTNSGTGSTSKSTISLWTKRSSTNSYQDIWESYSSGENYFRFRFRDDNRLDMQSDISNSTVFLKRTTRKFRDVSAWYHICVAIDLTQSNTDKIKLYINGTRETAFDNSTDLTSTSQQFVGGGGGYNFTIGRHPSSDAYYDGYMSEYVFVDGQALAPTDFGEFDSDSGIWKPKNVSGLTFGTNGFYLDFEDSSALGNDAAGSNNFTVNNLTSLDQSVDSCTNNFATLNPLAKLTGAVTLTEGNLKAAGDNSANHNWQTTFVVSSGKWYWELKDLTSSPDGSLLFYDQSIISGSHPGYGFVLNTRKKVINNSTSGSAIGSSAQNDIWSMALDLDNGKMFIARNGTYLESGDPANGTNPFIQTSDGLPSEGVFGGHVYNGSMQLNFGSPSFAISSGNTDGDGFGNFEFAVPSGFFSLCTKNLAEYG